jgi:hypothetical protein
LVFLSGEKRTYSWLEMYMKGTGLGMVTLASNPGILLTKYFTLSSETRVNLPDDENTE